VDGLCLPNTKPPAATVLKSAPCAHRVCTNNVSDPAPRKGSPGHQVHIHLECRAHGWEGRLLEGHLGGRRPGGHHLEDRHLEDSNSKDLGSSRSEEMEEEMMKDKDKWAVTE
jgi:hypothetical protein